MRDKGKNKGEDYFYFFKSDYLGKLLILGIIYAVLMAIAQWMFVLPTIYLLVPLSYISIVFSNNPDWSEMEIVKASFSIGNKKWLITFGTMFVCGILGALGALLV